MEEFGFYEYAAFIPIVAYSIILHEVAHAVAALWSGDDTAKLANRITLNPIPHIDPFGTILLPGILILSEMITGVSSPVIFGWAKPVPVNPLNFRRYVRGDIFVSLAGIITNLILAFIFILLLHLASGMNVKLFVAGAFVNIVLAVFNLIPVPPLDGSHIFKYLLPREARARYQALGFQGMFIIFIFLIVGGRFLHYIFEVIFKLFLFVGGHGWHF
jgi:Zn-dependent protease